MEKGQQWHMIRVEGNRAKKEEVEYRVIQKLSNEVQYETKKTYL